MPKARYYVVFEGREPGIYDNWPSCKAQVEGYPGGEQRGFASLAEAERAWTEAGGDPIPLDLPAELFDESPTVVSPRAWGDDGPVTASIAVDAACSGNPGAMEYRGVEIDTGEQLFLVGPMFGTNNLGEFLAIVHGLAWLSAQGRHAAIYSDSTTALNWVRRGQVRTTLARTAKSEQVWGLVERAHQWLRYQAPASMDLRKWPTKRWGEIPADFGRK